MSLFTSYFSSRKYSAQEHPLSKEDLHRLLVNHPILSVQHAERDIIEAAILTRRGGDGHISLRQIRNTLRVLWKKERKIQEGDFKKSFKLFEEYFGQFDK